MPAPARTPLSRVTVRGKHLAVRILKPLVGADTWDRLVDPLARDPKRTVRREARRATAERAAALAAMDLNQLAVHFKTDKWGSHRYTQHYARHLDHLRDASFTLLEIGIGGYRRTGDGGASLRMWQAYFPKAKIIGLDIEDKSFIVEPRVRVYQGDQTDHAVLQRIVDDAGSIEVVIDDGSHRPEHIRASFAYLFPRLAPDGVYAIEDTQTSYWPNWGGSENLHDPSTTMALVKDLVDGLNHEEFIDDDYRPTYVDEHVVAVHAYHNLVFVEKGVNREGSGAKRLAARGADPARPFGSAAEQRAPYSVPASVPVSD